ncbi:class I SAM-dependent methyltransferase [Elioraea sp. Yellowstone]|jgi:SAM-dependent methyltransferase|uniref:class I SAM-dependent methyltransferase n=1 Tax=Elioraea sp. Yellowstone TaxID=2592070 RepID=UPI00114F19C3|nr:class I SAM-dependent methyltransferase [Elioraea sp. Yellowstone]TQF79166.1 class I SAM-dependent methyltransferase [Elioraea sp. Yellowstone]
MAEDADALVRFYASPHGRVVTAALRARLCALWPIAPQARTLGLGFALPYLRLWRTDGRDRTVACLPAQIGPARWPRHRPNLTCVAEEERLPFPDLHFDRVLMVHALEHADNARRLLREAWRVLKDDGRLLVVVPNRTGWWAYAERTPFGHGRPFSADQLARLLEATLFRALRRDGALYLPPFAWRPLLRTAGAWERIGRRFGPRLAGVVILEAAKDMYAAIPAGEAAPARRRVVGAIDRA